MSLRTFHIFFIVVCLLFSIGFSIWLIRHDQDITLIVSAVACAAGLAIYLPWFIQKRPV